MGEYGLYMANFQGHDNCELRAIKDISRGEEVTTFYLKKLSRDCLKTKAERQKTFKDEYGFECRCEVCFRMTSSRRFASFEGHLVLKTFQKEAVRLAARRQDVRENCRPGSAALHWTYDVTDGRHWKPCVCRPDGTRLSDSRQRSPEAEQVS